MPFDPKAKNPVLYKKNGGYQYKQSRTILSAAQQAFFARKSYAKKNLVQSEPVEKAPTIEAVDNTGNNAGTSPPLSARSGFSSAPTFNSFLYTFIFFLLGIQQATSVDVIAFIHNEFDGWATDNKEYCSNSGFSYLYQCSWWSTVGAISEDGGNTFNLVQPAGQNTTNTPVFSSPWPYVLDGGLQGIIAISNFIQWRYFYTLVLSFFQFNIPTLSPGIIPYRTENLANFSSLQGFNGSHYNIPTVRNYPFNLSNAQSYIGKPILHPGYRLSWSYNTVLKKFIMVRTNLNYNNSGEVMQAFTYILASLDPDSGIFSHISEERLLMPINYMGYRKRNAPAQAYPSILDPTSPAITDSSIPNPTPGDLNYQYSGSNPRLYYTQLPDENNNDRDILYQDLYVNAQNTTNPVSILNPNALPHVVFNSTADGCPGEFNDFCDVPVRPFLTDANNDWVYWFSGNFLGNFKSIGDANLTYIRRVLDENGNCINWIQSQPDATAQPETYNNRLWAVVPYVLANNTSSFFGPPRENNGKLPLYTAQSSQALRLT